MMKFTTNDGVQLAFDDQGTGTPVVILTGIGGSRVIWENQVEHLLAQGYRVINVDARNQGASAHTFKGRRITRHAMDLAELLDHLNVQDVILLGNSMGAATIFAYVSLFGTAKVQAVIDVDQSPKMVADADWSFGFKNLTWEQFPTLLREPLGKATASRISDATFAKVQAVNAQYPYDAELNYPLLVDHAAQDWRDVLLQLKVPLLIVAGEKSPYFNPKFAEVCANLAPHGTAKVVAHAGHIVMAEQPAAFNQVLDDFLGKL